jgi:uncharacterized membrane protein
MANKNRHLILAYFPDVDAADAAGRQLKHWDKDEGEIKLGGMGIITEHDGKLKTHLIGARAGGTGAKWGAILGGTAGLATGVMVAVGVLTGGIGLIPGAIAGLVAGAAGGSLFHKRIGMTDADRARLEDHLRSGGAALAVMTDAVEMEPTKAEIAALGGAVEDYYLPDELMEELDQTRLKVEEARMAVADEMANKPVEVQEGLALMVAAANSLDAAAAAKLHAAGINDAGLFLAKAGTSKGRDELAKATGYSADTILKWAKELDLMRVHGISPMAAEALMGAGIDSVPELAQRNPENLAAALAKVGGATPYSVEQVVTWVAQAKSLPRVINF